MKPHKIHCVLAKKERSRFQCGFFFVRENSCSFFESKIWKKGYNKK